MKIHNFRKGFANNSSSSHSIVMVNGRTLEDSDVHASFGWNNFTCASKDAKRLYLAVQIVESVRNGAFRDGEGPQYGQPGHNEHVAKMEAKARELAQRITGVDLGVPGRHNLDAYVDHQSQLALPRPWTDTVLVDEDFANALMAYLDRDDIAVLGGNDNSSDHPLSGTQGIADAKEQMAREQDGYVARNDYPHWVLFNRKDGTKIRFSFLDDAPDYRKAAHPELVDIKITDFCPYGCTYCYQSSTERGGHADLEHIEAIAEVLADARVFEVALGGGEPTLHPSFHEIVEAFRSRGIVPNFTTRNMDWLRKAAQEGTEEYATLAKCGDFALSVDKADVVRDFYEIVRPADPRRGSERIHKGTFQYVIGSASDEVFRQILATRVPRGAMGRGVTLLGFKAIGRGSRFNIIDNGAQGDGGKWWSVVDDIVAENNAHNKQCEKNKNYESYRYAPRIGIDTALARQSLRELKRRKVKDWSYHVTEGAFSMYIDAVARTCGPSSYCSPMEMEPYASTSQVLDRFPTYPQEEAR